MVRLFISRLDEESLSRRTAAADIRNRLNATKELGADMKLEQDFLAAAKAGDVDKIKGLLAQGCNKNALELSNDGTPNGNALHIAALRGYSKVVQVLVDAGVDPNHRDAHGSTPLHMAATLGSPDVAKALCQARGIDINARDGSGWTPLHRACVLDRAEFIRALTDAGADINAAITTPTMDVPADLAKLVGMTPLKFAQTFGKNAAAAALITALAPRRASAAARIVRTISRALKNWRNLVISNRELW